MIICGITAISLTPAIFASIIVLCAALSAMSGAAAGRDAITATDNNLRVKNIRRGKNTGDSERYIYRMLALSAAAAFVCGAFGVAAQHQTVIFAATAALTVPYCGKRSVKSSLSNKNKDRYQIWNPKLKRSR